jgi:hypothetical protein
VELLICSLLVVKVGGAMFSNQSSRDVELQKVLELDVARAVEDAGRCKVGGAGSPQADGE